MKTLNTHAFIVNNNSSWMGISSGKEEKKIDYNYLLTNP